MRSIPEYGPEELAAALAKSEERARQQRVRDAAEDLLTVVIGFVRYYPGGINPALDNAYTLGLDALRKAGEKP